MGTFKSQVYAIVSHLVKLLYSQCNILALTYPSNHVAEQFRREIGDVQTSIMDPSSDLGVGEYSTMPQGVQEGYMFGHPHNGAEEYHRQS